MGHDPSNPRPGIDPIAIPAPGQQYGVRHVMFLVVACALLFTVIKYVGWVLLVFALTVVPVALVVGVIVLILNQLRSQQDAMLWAVAIAAERRLPLAPGIEAFADLCGGRSRRRSLALAHLVGSGIPLAEAIARVPRVFPRAATVYTRMGWDADVLARALRDVATTRAAWQPLRYSLTLRISYLGWVLFSLQVVACVVLYYIFPRYQVVPRYLATFAEFGIDLPAVTRVVIAAGEWFVRTGTLPILLVLEFALLVCLPMTFLDWFYWNVPLIDRLWRRRHAAAVLRTLSFGMEGGQPLPTMLEVLSRQYPSGWVRRRLRRIHGDVAAGADWLASLRARGFLRRTEAELLEASQRIGNLPWALRELADSIERRSLVRLHAWGQVLFPLIVVGVGGTVFVFAAAYFLPLVKLIEVLAR